MKGRRHFQCILHASYLWTSEVNLPWYVIYANCLLSDKRSTAKSWIAGNAFEVNFTRRVVVMNWRNSFQEFHFTDSWGRRMFYYAVPIKSSENKAYIMVRYLQGYWELDNKAIEMDIALCQRYCAESTFSFSFPISIIYFFRFKMFRFTRKRRYLRDLSLLVSKFSLISSASYNKIASISVHVFFFWRSFGYI